MGLFYNVPYLQDIFGAATDTTGSTLEWAMAELMRNPRTMEKAKQEVRNALGQGRAMVTGADIGDLHYLQMVIKETLRLHPSIPLIVRASEESTLVMGYDIPQGTNIFINAFSVARDPRYWKDADEFMPERFEKNGDDIKATTVHMGFIPFGAGSQCPGALFATTIIQLTLANLLYHFDWTLINGESPESLNMGEVLGIYTGAIQIEDRVSQNKQGPGEGLMAAWTTLAAVFENTRMELELKKKTLADLPQAIEAKRSKLKAIIGASPSNQYQDQMLVI
uniref:Cytochrome P450 n=1 Tax=Oryza meridionalis TaxID=40149 RepID=A0A0E0D2N0_9ORYZ